MANDPVIRAILYTINGHLFVVNTEARRLSVIQEKWTGSERVVVGYCKERINGTVAVEIERL